MKEKILHLIEVFDLKRFIKFGFIGVLNTLVDFVVFYLLNRFVIKDGPTVVLLGRQSLTPETAPEAVLAAAPTTTGL